MSPIAKLNAQYLTLILFTTLRVVSSECYVCFVKKTKLKVVYSIFLNALIEILVLFM